MSLLHLMVLNYGDDRCDCDHGYDVHYHDDYVHDENVNDHDRSTLINDHYDRVMSNDYVHDFLHHVSDHAHVGMHKCQPNSQEIQELIQQISVHASPNHKD